MQFKAGDFIYHPERGVGRIEAVVSEEPQEVILVFQGKEPETMPGYLLERGGKKISPQGFRALAYRDPTAAAQLLKDDPVEAICLVLEDFADYRALTDDLKEYLTPYVESWEKWWKATQPLLKESPRIDSSKSRSRKYGLHQELHSRADEAYLSYRRLKSFEEPSIVYAYARRALAEHFGGEKLIGDPLDDLFAYFQQVIASSEMPITFRIDALFRLDEWHAITSPEFETALEKLLQRSFSLVELDSYALSHLVEYLLQKSDQSKHLDLLAGGMQAGDSIARRLVDWAEKSGRPDLVALFLLAAISTASLNERQPPDTLDLSRRIEHARRLLRSIPVDDVHLPDIVRSTQKLCSSIARLEKIRTDKYLASALIKFAEALYLHVSKSQSNLASDVLESLVAPGLAVGFIVVIMELADTTKLSPNFQSALDQQFTNNIEMRKDEFLAPFVDTRWKDERERIKFLVELINRSDVSALAERAGRIIVAQLKKMQESEWATYQPVLVRLVNLPRDYSWKTEMSAFLERAYLFRMLHPPSVWDKNQQLERAVVQAAREFASIQAQDQRTQILEQQKQLDDLQKKITDLEKHLTDKDLVARELRSGMGGDTADARFEERSRFLKELVSAIGEFERYAASQSEPPKELLAILRRLESITSSFRVLPQEAPGATVAFNPQLHRLIEGSGVNKGDQVLVIERGFLIRDNYEKLRLLKSAFVKKL